MPNLFEKRELEPLFETKPQEQGKDKAVVSNAAYSDSIALQDPEGYEQYKENQTILPEALQTLQGLLRNEGIPEADIFKPENFSQLPLAQQTEVITNELNRINRKNASPRQYALISALSQGHGDIPMEVFDNIYRDVDPTDIVNRMAYDNRLARQAARRDLDQFVAAAGWNNGAEALMEVAVGDLTPIWPLLSRWGLIEMVEEAAGVEGVNGFWLGSGRQRLREAFVEMSPDEFNTAMKSVTQFIEEAQKDPIKGPLISKYNVLELFEAVFTEGVMDGTSAENAGDLYLGNVETFLEGLFSVVVIAKAGSTLMKTFTRTAEVSATNASRAAGQPHVATRIEDEFEVNQLSLDFNFLPDETVASRMPRPATIFENQIDELPDGTKSTVERSERIASNIIDRSGTATALGISATDKTKSVNRALTELDLNDSAHVHGRMNELAMFDDGSGYRMRVVVGENAEGGYKAIGDAMDEAVHIDPDLEVVNIMRVNGSGVLEPVFEDSRAFARALTTGEVDAGTAGRIAGGDNPDESFYLVYDREHFWNPIDKEVFEADTFQSGWMPRFLLAPNAKFGDNIYGSFLRAYMEEQSLIKDFDLMFNPYYDLGVDDKRFVMSVFEYAEDFGKNHGRAPDTIELMAKYPHMTDAQLKGVISIQTGMDTLHHLFDRKLYRQGVALDWKTARPSDSTMPNYHGKILDETVAARTASYYDPVSQSMVKLSKAEVSDVYNHGGGVMELDVPLEVGPRSRATHVVINSDSYEIGDLSTRLLKYHPGYSPRFYDDPYFIVKKTEGVEVNGTARTGAQGTFREAIKTAGTAGEANNFIRKANFRNQQQGRTDETFEVVRADDIDQTDSTLFQKEALHREGRLFWDERNFERLPDVNGNLAKLEDPNRALERLVGQASRQLSHEDLLRSVKNAWKNDYGDLIDVTLLDEFNLKELSDRLKISASNTVDKAAKQRMVDARELLDYMRLIEGTQSGIIPRLREASLDLATTVNAWTTKATGKTPKFGRSLEQRALRLDPFRAMRSIAFNVFLVFRPVRQALLQSAQIGYLAGLDPLYVASPRLFTDAYALRRGLTDLRKTGYDDGFSVKTMARTMGLSEREYRVLLREFDRSGLVDLVDVHSFAGGSARFRKQTLPETSVGALGYRAKQLGSGIRDFFQKWGFNFGERNNLTFTYNLAVRRALGKLEVDSVLDLSKKDWDNIRVDASNLALGMVKPNNFKYQTGGLGVATQFLSFSHKAVLGLLAQNPSITKADALRIFAGSMMLYGANMFGARDLVESALHDKNVPNYEVAPGLDVIDIISAGLIDSTFNALGRALSEDGEWKDVDFGFIAPGLDFPRFFDMTLRNIADQPYKAALGPFGNIASNVLQAYQFVDVMTRGEPDLDPADKFMRSAVVLGSAAFPALNDQVKAYLGYKMGLWYNQSNEAMPLRTTMNGLIARGLLGARTKEELAYYETQSNWYEQEDVYRDTVRKVNKYLDQSITLFYDGQASRDDVIRAMEVTANLFEDLPEGVRLQFRADVMNGIAQNDEIQPSIFKVIVDGALANPRIDPTQTNHLYDHMDIPPEHKEYLYELTEDAYSTKSAYEDLLKEETLEDGN